MNPYDFVPLDIKQLPERRKPVWHNALISTSTHPNRLYSGYLYLYIKAETPLFIQDALSSVQDPDYPGEHIRNQAGDYIIPGTSIKGLLRTVVETLCNGCMTVLDKYTPYPVPHDFLRCENNSSLCIACRLFGMMQKEQRNASVFLGKVNAGDAIAYEDTLDFYNPIYTAVLDAPKARHRAFYLDAQGKYIAGRKFYFHHNDEPRTENRLIEIRNKPGEYRNQRIETSARKYRNQHIEPLATGTEFEERIDFTNLEADEFAALLFAITLQPDMRHKIGYGKPIGLGSIQIVTTVLHLVDYTTRYTAFRSGRGMSKYGMNEVADLVGGRMAAFGDEQVNAAWLRFSSQPSLQSLHNIWKWPPDSSVVYSYPSQRWFKEHPMARIADTVDLYPGD